MDDLEKVEVLAKAQAIKEELGEEQSKEERRREAGHLHTNNRIDNLANSIDKLCIRIDGFMGFANNTMPIRAVYIMFILVFALIFGIQGIQFLFKEWLPTLLK